jgi:hypothetical protein
MQIVCSATSRLFPPDEPLTGPLRVVQPESSPNFWERTNRYMPS